MLNFGRGIWHIERKTDKPPLQYRLSFNNTLLPTVTYIDSRRNRSLPSTQVHRILTETALHPMSRVARWLTVGTTTRIRHNLESSSGIQFPGRNSSTPQVSMSEVELVIGAPRLYGNFTTSDSEIAAGSLQANRQSVGQAIDPKRQEFHAQRRCGGQRDGVLVGIAKSVIRRRIIFLNMVRFISRHWANAE